MWFQLLLPHQTSNLAALVGRDGDRCVAFPQGLPYRHQKDAPGPSECGVQHSSGRKYLDGFQFCQGFKHWICLCTPSEAAEFVDKVQQQRWLEARYSDMVYVPPEDATSERTAEIISLPFPETMPERRSASVETTPPASGGALPETSLLKTLLMRPTPV
ncbi:hypothetical protein NPIL_9391 [Nephila pilipes]|uniref:Uncharacterized protein n=1 Tax=Nephila pilipes TaxID=299642 RepID=A0A8X6MVY6_NEPPI|nr:hypothetical protein NPIL_9391 [Nephila pilipes]